MFCRCGFHLPGWCVDDVASRTDADVRRYAGVCVAVAALVEKQEIRTTRARSVLSAEDLLPACVVALNLAQISSAAGMEGRREQFARRAGCGSRPTRPNEGGRHGDTVVM